MDAFTDDTPSAYYDPWTTHASVVQRERELLLSATDGPDPDIVIHLVKHWKECAKSKFDAGEYAAAEIYLGKVLKRSEFIQGARFEGRAETVQMLALALSRQGKWHETDVVLREKFDGREETMEQIATDCREQRNWEQAEKILLDLWNRPTVPRDHSSPSQRSIRLKQAFAEVYFGKEDYASAEKWCHQATREIKANVGMKDPLFFESIDLLARVYNANGDVEEAEAYRALIPRGFIEYRESIECQDIEKLSQMNPKEAAAEVGTRLLRGLQPFSLGGNHGLDEIRASILENGRGIIGSYLIHSLAFMGLDWPVHLLLEKGADVDAKTLDIHDTPLMLAAVKGHVAVILVLLEKGAKVNERNCRGWTALHAASHKGCETIVRMLVEKGAKPELKCSTGETAAEIAVSKSYGRNYPAIRDFLNSLK